MFLGGALLFVTRKLWRLLYFANIGDKEGYDEQHTEKNRRYLNWCRSHERDFGIITKRVSTGMGNQSV
jgi:hypothetical protein